MAIRNGILVGLLAFWVLFIVSCAVSTDYSEGSNPMPDNWVLESPDKLNQCASVDGAYQVLGLGRLKAKDPLSQTRLDVAMGHAFPSNGMPSEIHFFVDTDINILTYKLGHPVDKILSIPTDCQDGWYKSEKKLNDRYIGEGGKLDYSIRKIELGRSVDGALLVHLKLETQSSSYLVFKAHDTREIWSKYEEVKNKNF